MKKLPLLSTQLCCKRKGEEREREKRGKGRREGKGGRERGKEGKRERGKEGKREDKGRREEGGGRHPLLLFLGGEKR